MESSAGPGWGSGTVDPFLHPGHQSIQEKVANTMALRAREKAATGVSLSRKEFEIFVD